MGVEWEYGLLLAITFVESSNRHRGPGLSGPPPPSDLRPTARFNSTSVRSPNYSTLHHTDARRSRLLGRHPLEDFDQLRHFHLQRGREVLGRVEALPVALGGERPQGRPEVGRRPSRLCPWPLWSELLAFATVTRAEKQVRVDTPIWSNQARVFTLGSGESATKKLAGEGLTHFGGRSSRM
jgi:hypothetical protein